MSVIRNSGSTKMLHSCELYRSALTSQCVKSFDLIETQQLRRCYTIDATAAASATTTIAIHLLLMLVYSDVVAGLCQTSNLTPQIPCFSTLFDIYIYFFSHNRLPLVQVTRFGSVAHQSSTRQFICILNVGSVDSPDSILRLAH